MKTAEMDQELAALNQAVEDALAARKSWMDAHMADYAKYQIGEDIYNKVTGVLLGTVCGYYRYHAGKNPRLDTSMSIDYLYKSDTHSNYTDNTSRQIGLSICNRAELAQIYETEAKMLRSKMEEQK